MTTSDFDRKWEKLAEEVLSGMKEWRILPSTGDIEGVVHAANGAEAGESY